MKEQFSNLEDGSEEMIQSEVRKREEGKEEGGPSQWGILPVRGESCVGKEGESTWKEMASEMFPKVGKDTNLRVQKFQRTLNKMN